MTNRILRTPLGKKMKIAIAERDVLQQKLARRLSIANSTVSGVICGHNRCEHTKERITETLGIQG